MHKKLFAALIFLASPAHAAPLSEAGIQEIYGNSTSLSSAGTHVNFYAEDGTFVSTNINNGERAYGKWYTKGRNKLCISRSKERCWRITEQGSKICFSAKGQKECRQKADFLSGDRTQDFVKE